VSLVVRDALKISISMSLKCRGEIDSATFDNLMEKDGNVVYELSCLASNNKEGSYEGFGFFSFL
jgi:hypothetical protein